MAIIMMEDVYKNKSAQKRRKDLGQCIFTIKQRKGAAKGDDGKTDTQSGNLLPIIERGQR